MSDGNFRMRCVYSCSNGFLINKEYDVIDGHIHNENGIYVGVYNSVQKINNEFGSQFELVEEKKNENMSKWNGKIRCISPSAICCYTKDKVYIVKDGSFLDDGGRELSGYESFYHWCEHSYAKWEEVVEVKEMEDLRELIKPCMLVKFSDGCLAKVEINFTDELVFSGENWFPVDKLNKDLVYGQHKVVELYGRSRWNKDAHLVSCNGRTIIWKREEKSPQQIKIEEIERKQRELADELAELRKDM